MAKMKYYNGTSWQVLGSEADKVSYDNTISGLTAIDVKGAIDETSSKLPITKTGLSLTLANWVDNTATTGFFEQVITDSDVTTTTILDLYFDSQDIKDHMQDVGASYLTEQAGSYLIQMETAPLADVNYKLIINKEV